MEDVENYTFQSLRASIPVGDGAPQGGDKGLFISYPEEIIWAQIEVSEFQSLGEGLFISYLMTTPILGLRNW